MTASVWCALLLCLGQALGPDAPPASAPPAAQAEAPPVAGDPPIHTGDTRGDTPVDTQREAPDPGAPGPWAAGAPEGLSAGWAEPAPPSAERPELVLRTLLGLVGVMVLAYLGGHPRVLRLEERLGIAQVITAGFPFVLLGWAAHQPGVGILTAPLIVELTPLLRIGLALIGLVVGLRFDARLLQRLPRGAGQVVVLTTVLPAALVAGASCLALGLLPAGGAEGGGPPVFLRDALILGAAGAMTARSAARVFTSAERGGILYRVVLLEELAAVLGLALVAAFFRPSGPGVSWQLPGAAWFLVTVGLGTTLGVLMHVILQRTKERADFLVLALGSICFAAGAAATLLVSPVVVAFLAGVLLANLPGEYHDRLRDMLRRLERPVYLLTLVVVGALWEVGDWRGWVLVPVFAVARLAGKLLATALAARVTPLLGSAEERAALAISPIGSLSIAIVISARLIYPEDSSSMLVSAVIGGGVLTEICVQVAGRTALLRRRAAEPAAPAAQSGAGSAP